MNVTKNKKVELPEPHMYIEKGPDTKDKIFYWALGLFFLAFLISLPFMWRDKQAYEAKQWHDYGCQMYDDYAIKNVPAKCQADLIDHYKAQAPRLQPPDER